MSQTPYQLPNRPMNPDFGNGIFRRRLRLTGYDYHVVAELEDCNHGFRSVVHHNGQQVTKIDAEDIRAPLTTCHGAVPLIQDLLGTSIHASLSDITRAVNPRSNCTHLYDLTTLAIQHCSRGNSTRTFDVSIPDEKDGPTQASVTMNGEPLLSWSVYQWQLQDEELKGKSLAAGFGKWASQYYSGDKKDAAFVLQKGYLVSNARKFDMSKLQGTPVEDYDSMLGSCYSYSLGVVENASRTMNTTRDFTDSEEQLLKFL